jgi:biofilm PGA synthesis N-glycosyltransferase PgaC
MQSAVAAHDRVRDATPTTASEHEPSASPPGRPGRRVVALVPAHNEEAGIAAAVGSLLGQSRRPDRVIVVADNCTDRTVARAKAAGANVLRSVRNDHRKAGALNQALNMVLPTLAPDDVVMVMDADSVIADDWLEVALATLDRPGVGAVGGIFYGQRGAGFIGLLQRMEYVRYARQLARRAHSRAFVLTGTATAFAAATMREVAEARRTGAVSGGDPDGLPVYYHEQNITEDSELTLAVKTLGHECVSPMECWVSTEVMPTWRALWRQRVRWQRGALENLRSFGLTRVTLPYAARQLWSLVELLFFLVYLTLTAVAALDDTLRFSPLWLVIGAIFVVERVVSVRRAGPVAVLVALSMVTELGYGLFKHALNVKCLYDIGRGRAATWS